MTDEMIVRIKRPMHLKAPLKYADEHAVVQFSREELIILKLAIRRHLDCSEEEYSYMSRLINAASAGFEVKADRQFAEEDFGVMYQGNCADGFSYYYYTYYTNVMLLEDGTCSFDLSSAVGTTGSVFWGITSGEVFSHNDLYFIGYEDLDSLFNKHVTSKIGEYKYESTVH